MKNKNSRLEFYETGINETRTKAEDLLLVLSETISKVLQTSMSHNRPFYTQRASKLVEQAREKVIVLANDYPKVDWKEGMKTAYRIQERQELLDSMRYRECKQEWQNQLQDVRTLTDITRILVSGNLSELLKSGDLKLVESVNTQPQENLTASQLLDKYMKPNKEENGTQNA